MGTKPGRRRIERYHAALADRNQRLGRLKALKVKDLILVLEPAFSDLPRIFAQVSTVTKPSAPDKLAMIFIKTTARWSLAELRLRLFGRHKSRESRASAPWHIVDLEHPGLLDELEHYCIGLRRLVIGRMIDAGRLLKELMDEEMDKGELAMLTYLKAELHHGKKGKDGQEKGPHDSPGPIREYQAVFPRPRKADKEIIQQTLARWQRRVREAPSRAERQRRRQYIRAIEGRKVVGSGREQILSSQDQKDLRKDYRAWRPRLKTLWNFLEEGYDVSLQEFQHEFGSTSLERSFIRCLFSTRPTRFAPYRWLVASLAIRYRVSPKTVERSLRA